jgi:geranylgeranyl diphosphate synthase type I
VNYSTNLLGQVQANLDSFCQKQRSDFEAISADLIPVVDYTQSLLQGGKRFRALFCYWAWKSCLDDSSYHQSEQEIKDSELAIAGIAASLEMFHAAALVLQLFTSVSSHSTKKSSGQVLQSVLVLPDLFWLAI